MSDYVLLSNQQLVNIIVWPTVLFITGFVGLFFSCIYLQYNPRSPPRSRPGHDVIHIGLGGKNDLADVVPYEAECHKMIVIKKDIEESCCQENEGERAASTGTDNQSDPGNGPATSID